MGIWDGHLDGPEDESEQLHQWETEGDLPWAPHHVDDADEWKAAGWPEDAYQEGEYGLFKRDRDQE